MTSLRNIWTPREAWRVGMGLIAIGALRLVPERDRGEATMTVCNIWTGRHGRL